MGLDNRRPRGFSDRKIAARGHCAGVGVTQGRGEGSTTAGLVSSRSLARISVDMPGLRQVARRCQPREEVRGEGSFVNLEPRWSGAVSLTPTPAIGARGGGGSGLPSPRPVLRALT
ncbi:unnamed protein product [Rangifer tarandus platyrhynchus]|uniref:Uncharacterized protein n=1 Tax=Rangifer tarandus platyrhynchus TaxID=3082113 RepID=A0AC60A959_RANTA